MDKGQHLRLVITDNSTDKFIGLATDMTLHLSAQTEDATTKDTTDTTGSWLVYDVTGRSGDIQFGSLMASRDNDSDADPTGLYLEDLIDKISDTPMDWKVLYVNGTKNRTKVKTICTGKGKLTNLQVSAQNRQNATLSGTLNIYGPVTVGTD